VTHASRVLITIDRYRRGKVYIQYLFFYLTLTTLWNIDSASNALPAIPQRWDNIDDRPDEFERLTNSDKD
jgi:hypothetical protein